MAVRQQDIWRHLALYACLAALITAVVSLLQNAASILPPDPTQGGQQGT